MKCFSPESVPRPAGKGSKDRITVRCGRCLGCLMTKRSEWTFRLKQELKDSETAHFVTLTYDDQNITMNDKGKYTLVKSDLQKYFKKLRIANEGEIKYFAVGEYGGLTRRPHYHIILFNADSKEDIILSWSKYSKESESFELKGKVDIGNVQTASIHYVTGYLIGSNFEFGEYDDREVEHPFRLMSKGLGENYLFDNYTWHKQELKNYLEENRIKQALPRYYSDKIFSAMDKERIKIQAEIQERLKDFNPIAYINQQRKTERFNRKNSKIKL